MTNNDDLALRLKKEIALANMNGVHPALSITPDELSSLLAERDADKEEIALLRQQVSELSTGWGNCQLTMGVYCHAYEEAKAHIAELLHNHRVHAARLLDERGQLKTRIAELEARTVSVKLLRYDLDMSNCDSCGQDCGADMSEEPDGDYVLLADVVAKLAAAGITLVVGGEDATN